MLNGFVERLMLAAPVDAKPAAVPTVNGAGATGRVEVIKKVEVVELSLFPVNGKLEDVAQKAVPAATQKPTPPSPANPAAQAPPKPSEPAPRTEVKSVPEVPAAAASAIPTAQPALAPQWKIVSAAESFAASAAQAKSAAAPQAPVAQAQVAQPLVPTASATPAPAVPAAATDTSVGSQTAPQAAPSGPPPRLTPYAATKWGVAGEVDAPLPSTRPTPEPAKSLVVVENLTNATPAPATVQTSASRAMRERYTIEELAERRPRPGLLIGGLAAVAIVVGIFIFKPSPQTQAPSTAPVVAASSVVAANPPNAVKPAVVHSRAAVKPAVTIKPSVKVAATSAPAATPKPATPRPATAAPATPKPAAQTPPVVVTRPRPAPRHIARYGKLYQPESGSVVALGGIEAFYGPRGRAVRVIWSSAEQASASVSLIDDRGATVNSVSVRGGRQSAILYLPRGYRGGLTVQVSSIGRLGERVAQTTSLPAFGF